MAFSFFSISTLSWQLLSYINKIVLFNIDLGFSTYSCSDHFYGFLHIFCIINPVIYKFKMFYIFPNLYIFSLFLQWLRPPEKLWREVVNSGHLDLLYSLFVTSINENRFEISKCFSGFFFFFQFHPFNLCILKLCY